MADNRSFVWDIKYMPFSFTTFVNIFHVRVCASERQRTIEGFCAII